eukprot:tig00020961_g16718.t1
MATTSSTLDAEQQRTLNEKKARLRVENEYYLREHPELSRMISMFLAEMLEKKPDNVLQFAGKFFTAPELATKVQDGTNAPSVTSSAPYNPFDAPQTPSNSYLELLEMSAQAIEDGNAAPAVK